MTEAVPSRSPRLPLLRSAWALLAGLVLGLSGCSGGDSTGPGDTTPQPTPAFTLSAAPTSLSVVQGAQGTVTVSVARSGGFTGAVSVAVEGLPGGVTASALSVAGNATSGTLTLSAGAQAAAGSATLTLRGTGSGVEARTATVNLSVEAAPSPDFQVGVGTSTLELQAGSSAQVAVTCAILATLLTTLYQLAAIVPPAMEEVRGVAPRYRLREWVAVSLPIFLVDGFFYLHTNADILMIGWFMEPQDVAVYFATLKLLALVHFVYFAVKAGVAQRYAQYAHGGDRDRLAAFARETVSWTFWPSLAMAAAMLALGKPMLALFGEGFEAGYPLLVPLMAGVVARAFVGPAESLLTMSGHQNACASVFAVTLAVNLALNLTLIPLWGLWGAALATATAMVVEALLLALAVRRRLGIVMIVPLGGARNKEVLP